jgi:hypothetical protein
LLFDRVRILMRADEKFGSLSFNQTGALAQLPIEAHEVKGRWLPSTPPTSSAVPAATQKNQHYDDDDEKCRRVHVALPG